MAYMIIYGTDNTQLKVSPEDYHQLKDLTWSNDTNGYYKNGHKSLHQIIFKLKTGRKPRDGMCIDHINQDRLDNTRENLREVTLSENSQNRKKKEPGKFSSDYKGVCLQKNNKGEPCGYMVSCTVNGVNHFTSQKSEHHAAQNYNDFLEEYGSGVSEGNIIPEEYLVGYVKKSSEPTRTEQGISREKDGRWKLDYQRIPPRRYYRYDTYEEALEKRKELDAQKEEMDKEVKRQKLLSSIQEKGIKLDPEDLELVLEKDLGLTVKKKNGAVYVNNNPEKYGVLTDKTLSRVILGFKTFKHRNGDKLDLRKENHYGKNNPYKGVRLWS
jgi:HNH endonuclease